MNNYALFFIVCVFSFGCLAQNNDRYAINTNTKFISDNMSNSDYVVVSYHVEERINLNIGRSITTYDVSSLSRVATNDLGPNNTRIITPKYAKAKKDAVVNIEQPKISIDSTTTKIEPVEIDDIVKNEKKTSISIDLIPIYERTLDKGYQSVDMLKKVGDSRFFRGDLVTAAKWYTQLFGLTTDLDIIYYYRFSKSLVAINQIEKANEMMKIFESKNK